MITTKRCILIAEKCEFLERFEATEFADISEIQNVWKRNKTPIISDKLVANKLAGYNVLNVPEEIIGNVEAFTDFCHENGFECGEFISGITYDTAQERCFMCELARHRGMGDLVRYNQYVEKTVDCIIYETENFYVTSELGALKLGYLMIVPKEHILSVAQFPERLFDEYQEVKEDTEKMLKVAFDGSSVTFWEHGSGPSGKTSHKKSIVHAHTHVVVDFELKEKYQDMVQLRPCFDITEAKYVHYFSYQEGSKGQLMISMDPSVYIQRQYPRQIMADELGFAPDQYNWRKVKFEENIDATLFHLFRTLKECTDDRIKERTRGFVEGFSNRTLQDDE